MKDYKDYIKTQGPQIFVDMDGCVAKWKSDATPEDLLTIGYFRNLEPQKNLIEALEILAKDYNINILSVANLTPSIKDEKTEWLKFYMPFVNKVYLCDDLSKPVYYMTNEHTLIEPKDFLIDDLSKNLHEWEMFSGTGIKFYNGINGNNGTWTGFNCMVNQTPMSLASQIKGIINIKEEENDK